MQSPTCSQPGASDPAPQAAQGQALQCPPDTPCSPTQGLPRCPGPSLPPQAPCSQEQPQPARLPLPCVPLEHLQLHPPASSGRTQPEQ